MSITRDGEEEGLVSSYTFLGKHVVYDGRRTTTGQPNSWLMIDIPALCLLFSLL